MIEYKKLVKLVEADIQKRKKPFEVDRAVNATKEQVKTIAVTEVQDRKRILIEKDLKEAKSELKDGEKLLVKISLNPRRSWIGYDICDEIANKDVGYGKGVYEYGKVHLPPQHPRCQCGVTFFKKNS